MKKFTVILLVFLMITGCGGMGKVANLKSEFLPNDSEKTCEQLGIEIASVEDDIADVKDRLSTKKGGNVTVAVLGVIFLPALCAMDFGKTEETELRSYEKRFEVLKKLSATRECGFEFKTYEVEEVKDILIKVEKDATDLIADSYE